ncbi:Lrp/AsnC ligand binding domain-containing protein [Leucobacter sp. HNU]|uniref:Lrp/AsnC ligand binding domain-containing protein n=1 Tax=Leucobacter sp. HNU TaxID=3236805 RepID=UPI003A8028A3
MRIAKIPEIVRCDILTGEYDLLVRVDAHSVERVQEIWEEVSALPGVANTVTSFSLSTMIDRGA